MGQGVARRDSKESGKEGWGMQRGRSWWDCVDLRIKPWGNHLPATLRSQTGQQAAS